MPLLELKRTAEEQTRERALGYIANVVRAADGAVASLKTLAEDRGGRAAFLTELGELAQGIRDAALDMRALVVKLSDLPGQDLEG